MCGTRQLFSCQVRFFPLLPSLLSANVFQELTFTYSEPRHRFLSWCAVDWLMPVTSPPCYIFTMMKIIAASLLLLVLASPAFAATHHHHHHHAQHNHHRA